MSWYFNNSRLDKAINTAILAWSAGHEISLAREIYLLSEGIDVAALRSQYLQ